MMETRHAFQLIHAEMLEEQRQVCPRVVVVGVVGWGWMYSVCKIEECPVGSGSASCGSQKPFAVCVAVLK